jgi:HAE1 family hydrophobic/amphiphilic exporter-1
MARFFVNRPIVAMVISIITVMLGLVAMKDLPIAQYPEIVPPMIQVTTTFIGASATDVEASVATPLEQQINGVENMIYMKSTNANDGTLTLRVSFEVGSNLDMNNVLTQNRVSQGMPQMPQSVKNYGVSVKKALAFPLLVLSVKSPKGTYDSNFLSNYTTINITDAISRIQGVGQVNLFGGSDYAMRVWLRPDVIGRLGLTIPDIANAISQQNQLSPAGQIGGPPAAAGTEYTYTVRTQGRLLNEEEFGNIIVRTTAGGSEVRLKDIARLELGTMLYNAVGRHNGTPSAVIAVFQIPGTNAIDVADKIKATMNDLSKRFPRDMEYLVSLDTTLPVVEGIKEIEHTLFEAVALVIIVVFVFLQNWRATLIPLMTVPVSLVGAFIFFPLLGFSINVLSLLGLVLAIGIVVDDAIVVVEAVMHHIEHGMAPKEATIKAMEEVSGPVVAIGLILSAVFVPVGFMGGITGRLYQQFAITIALSVLLSVVNALTLSPALAALLLKPATGKKSLLTPFYNGFNRVFGYTTDRYVSFAGILVRKSIRSMAFIGILCYVIVMLVQRIPAGFVPEEDQGYILVNALLPDAASLERTDAVMRKAEGVLKANPHIEGFNTISGYSLLTGAYSSNIGFFFVQLKEWAHRPGEEAHSNGIVASLNRAFAQQIPEAAVVAFGPPAIPGLGTGAGFTMQLQDRSGGSTDYLAQQTAKFIEAARKRPEIGRINTLYRASVPQIYADIDRSKVLKAGVPLNDVNTTLGALLGSSYVNDFNRFGRVYKVYVQAEPEFRRDPKQLGLFFVRNKDGGSVPLDTLLATRPGSGPEFTNRFNLFRTAELTGVPASGYSSTQALNALEETARSVLPADMTFDWADMSYQERKAPGVALVFMLAIFLVFLILAAQYESWGLPFSVLLGTPFAAFGAYFGLWAARELLGPSYVNNVFAQIGLIMLIGLAAKNAILIVEFAKMEHDQGKGLVEAALNAAKLRFRPILMTAFAFILGVVPLLTATGAGAEARKVMGMTVFSGMLIATILGVLLIPMLFVVVERVMERVTGGSKKHVPVSAAAPPPLAADHGHGGH